MQIRTSTMSQSKDIGTNSGTAGSDRITALTTTGFTVGTADSVNKNGLGFIYLAFDTTSAESAVGSYTGNGTADRAITGLGFQPDMVMTTGSDGRHSVFRITGMPANMSLLWTNIANNNRIKSLTSDGFTLGNEAAANENGVVYHYMAFKNVTGKFNAGSYVGTGASRSVTGVGFLPEAVFARQYKEVAPSTAAVAKFASQGDARTLILNASPSVLNVLTSLDANGFSIGSDDRVNQSSITNYYMAWKRAAAGEATQPTLTATPTSTSVTHNSATLGGDVTATGGASISARGVVYALTSANGNPEIGGSSVTVVPETGTFSTGSFTRSATSLAASSGYSFKAYATNSAGASYSSVGTFTTSAAPAVAPTLVATPTSASVSYNAATLGGNVSATGGANVTARGVVYALTSANANPEIGGANVTNLPETGTFGTGAFTRSASSLTASSGYSFKAYATNSAGTAYSSAATFTTAAAPGPPTIYDFENVTNGQTTFVSSSQTWSLTGYMANVISSALGSPLAGAASPGSNGYIETGWNVTRGLENVGGIKAPAGRTFKALSFDVWPSQDEGDKVYGGDSNQLGTVGLKYRVVGKLNNAEVVSADVTDTVRSPAQTGTSAGGYWHHLDLSSTAFASTDIDTVEFVLVSQTGALMNYLAVDNFEYIELQVAAAPSSVAVSSLNRVGVQLTNAASVTWTLTFASAVTGVTASNFDLTGAGTTGASIGTPTTANGGVTWTVPVTTGVDGTLTLRLTNATGLSASISSSLPYASAQSFTIDKTPPDTTITNSPANPTSSTSGAFQFTGTDGSGSGVSYFETKLDSATFVTGTSPRSYSGLTEASHTFQVRAVDAAGNVDPAPASFTWEVDLTPPVVQSVTRLNPAGQNVTANTVVFRVTYSEVVTLTTPETARYTAVPVNGSTITADVTSVSGSGATRDVTVTVTGGEGEFRLRVLN